MSKAINKAQDKILIKLDSLKDFCNASKIKNFLSYGKKILVVDNKIDGKTKNIADFILDFYSKAQDKEKFYLNLGAIIHYFYNEKHEDIKYISLSAVNRALQYINTLENSHIFVIEFFTKNKEIFFRIRHVGCKSIVSKKKITSQEIFENRYKSIEKSYNSIKEEFDVYQKNNKSLKKVEKFRADKKAQEKKAKSNK